MISPEEQKYWDEQALLDALNEEVIEDQALEERYHKEMEWAIRCALEDFAQDL